MSAATVGLFAALLFLDGATFSLWTTIILYAFARELPPWFVAAGGSVASGLGSIVQFVMLRWVLGARHPWMRRFAPSRERLEAALARYPSASFATILIARATPLPDAPVKLVAAAVRYPAPLYLLAVVLGALPYYFLIGLFGRAFRFPIWTVVVAVIAIGLFAVVERLLRRRREPS